jgi:hypothetical protein
MRRGSTVVVLDVERGGAAELEGSFALEVPSFGTAFETTFETTARPTLRRGMTGSAASARAPPTAPSAHAPRPPSWRFNGREAWVPTASSAPRRGTY